MSTPSERYQNLSLRESLPKVYRFPIACKELSSIIREAYDKIPKNLQAIIFQDTIAAFRVLPEIRTRSAVSSAHLLLQSVEAALPKQKRNMAVTEFKHAMVSYKRRCKAQQEETGSAHLPHDVLMHIFSFLDMQSLVSVGLVCWSWNVAANENHLWELQYAVLYDSSVIQQPIKPVEDRSTLRPEPIDTRAGIDWKEEVKAKYTASSKKLTSSRGYCRHCKTVVWLNNSNCPNPHYGLKSGIQYINPVTACQVVEYLLNECLSITSSSDSDSDSEETVFRLWAYPKHIKRCF